MKKNFKVLYAILMASFLSNTTNLTTIAHARPSRQVVVNSSNTENSIATKGADENSQKSENNSEDANTTSTISEDSNTTGSATTTDTTSSSTNSNAENSETVDQSNTGTGTSSIFEILNSDKDITLDEISEYAMPVSYQSDFIKEFKTTFPDLDPLRKISQTDKNLNMYLDVNSNETKEITKYLTSSKGELPVYAEQNMSSVLLDEIGRLLKDITDKISKEYPSTIFSLIPTLEVFNDTYKILKLEYTSIIENNSTNQITPKILLKDVQEKLSSLLSAVNEFDSQIPELVETLNKLVESTQSSSNNKNETTSNSETVYIGEFLQELMYDKATNKFYELNPEKPDSEEYIEYTGNVTEMTRDEYLNIDLFFDTQGNQLSYDANNKTYYAYNAETNETVPYEGEVKTVKMKDFLGITEESTETSEETTKEEVSEEETTEETTEEETAEEETTEETAEEETTEETAEEEVVEETAEEEQVDPKTVTLYFGDVGQELEYDEKEKKYYQINPEKPDSEEYVEYTGEVTTMSLADYWNMDLFFDENGNQLTYDADTNSYFFYNEEKDEFALYEGKVTKMKMKEFLEQE